MEGRERWKLPLEQDLTEIIRPDARVDGFTVGLAAGHEIGAYCVDQLIGSGGGGSVYAAHHRSTKQPVAIKVLHAEAAASPAMVARFVLEAEAVNKIAHPNIVNIYEFAEIEPGRPYYVMELLEGMDLAHLLRLRGRFSPREVLALLGPILDAVQAAHEAGFLHRDIKANNIVVAGSEGQQVPKLLDFGIAKLLHAEAAGAGLTEPGAVLGTAHNMAPEQIRGEPLDARTDVYALGILLFQLLTGQHPFGIADPRDVALLHLQAPVPRPSLFAPLPPALDALVLRCLEKRREPRFGTVSELHAALRRAAGELTPEVHAANLEALGVYVEVPLSAPEQHLDHALLADLVSVLDRIERELAADAFDFPIRTSNALLGVRTLPAEVDAAREHRAFQSELQQLLSKLAERPRRHPAVRVTVSLTLGQVLCSSGERAEVLGGPLLEVSKWAEQNRLPAALRV